MQAVAAGADRFGALLWVTAPDVEEAAKVMEPKDQAGLAVPGTTIPLTQAYVYARANGYLQRRLVDIGDHVKKGQVLARYHADEVREERAKYRAAVAELRLAETTAAQAQRNRDRAQRLLELKAGSIQQLEQ